MSKRRLRIDLAIDRTQEPIFVLDSKRRVVFFNQGCVELCGWPAEDVLGLTCLFANEPDRTSLAALTGALAPPDEVLEGEPHSVAKYFVHRQTGHSVARLVHFYLLRTATAEPHVLGIVSDLAKSKTAAEPSVVTQIHAELGALRHALRQRYRLNSMIAKSPAMLRVLEQINAARHTMVSVAVIGDQGVGKEHVARAIHYESDHGAKAFVPLDCQHLPPADLKDSIERLIASDWDLITPVSALHPGCLYLRHVEHLPRDLQQRLVEFFAVDSGKAFRKHVRLIVSSDQDLAEAVTSGALIEEFYFQASSLRISIPPLREREGELRLFAQHFVEECNRSRGRQVTGLAPEVRTLFDDYNWPGNLDELRQVVMEAHASCDGLQIMSSHLPLRFRSGLDAQSLSPNSPVPFEPLESLLSRVERAHVEAALQQAKGNKTLAAKLLGLSRVALNSRLENFGIGLGDDAGG